MQLISDIINELIDSDKSLVSPLLKTKVLASRLKNTELLTWTNNELNGYTKSMSIPEYRKVNCNISGTYISGHHQFNNQPLPTSGLPKAMESEMRNIDFDHSVAALESMAQADKEALLESIFPAEIVGLLQRNIRKLGNPYVQLLNAKKVTSITSVTQILSVVRSNMLDLMIKIDEEFNNITEIEDLKKNNERIINIMNQTIINNTNTGDGNVLNTGENANIHATINITKGDKINLQKKLVEQGIEESDAVELITLIDEEKPNAEQKTFGPTVNSWIQKMIGKALDGTWQIGVGAAGSVLAEAIQSYYGMK